MKWCIRARKSKPACLRVNEHDVPALTSVRILMEVHVLHLPAFAAPVRKHVLVWRHRILELHVLTFVALSHILRRGI